ncbi:MAG: arsenate reductase ArsC [Fimbriimonadaceae bacterium]|nr:arsenate reductase ArsC [Fimbriimonadaceae bacterium]QYK55184.1 MAG: arsenate reductase ArsC [Fimbriimonadaceae bacterium]
MPEPYRLLVICTGNRARSQMAEGFLRHYAKGRFEVLSAGTWPKGVHPIAIEVMQEVGIDISNQTSDHVAEYQDRKIDCAVTVCDAAKEACPVFPNAVKKVHHSFPDPDQPGSHEEVRALFRTLRDQIGEWAKGFAEETAAEIGAAPAASEDV